jgi:hypothetical protein
MKELEQESANLKRLIRELKLEGFVRPNFVRAFIANIPGLECSVTASRQASFDLHVDYPQMK